MSNEYDDLIAAQPAQQANEYDVALQLNQDQQQTQLRSSIAGAVKVNPDQYAQAKQLSSQTGIPAEVVHRNLPEVADTAKVNEYDALLKDSPVLQAHMRDPEFAKVAHDDLSLSKAIEYTVRTNMQGMQTGWHALRALAAGVGPDLAAGVAGVGQAVTEFGSNYVGDPLAQWGILPADPFAAPAEFFANTRQTALAQAEAVAGTDYDAQARRLATLAGEPIREPGRIERDIVGGLRMTGQNLPALAAALATGQPELALQTITGEVAGQQYGEARDQGLSPERALPYASSQAAIQLAAQKLPVGTLFKNLNEASPLYKTFLQTTAHAVPSQVAAGFLSGVNEWANLNPDKSFSDLMAEQPSAMLDTLLQTIVATGADAGLGHAGNVANRRQMQDRVEVEKAKANAASLETLTAQAVASKLRERDPASFQQFVQTAAGDGPVQDVYVDAKQLMQTLEQSGVSPAEVAKKSPAVAEQLQEALQTGGDLRIPIGEYAAHMAAEKYAPALLPHLRTSPDSLSAAEAQTFEQSHAERFKKDATEAMAAHAADSTFQTSANAVHDQVLGQLNDANRFTSEVNQGYAGMVRDFYATQAHRLGITPEEMFKRYPLKIQAESVAGEHQLNQLHVPRAENLSPEHADIQERFARQVESNPEKAIEDYAKLPESEGGKVLNTDVARELSSDYRQDRSKSAAVHEPASALIKEIYKRKLAEPPKAGEEPLVLFTAGGTGAGKTTTVNQLQPELKARAQIVYDTNMNGLDSSVKKIEQALAAGKQVAIDYIYRHPIEAFTNGMLGRAFRMERDKGSGRTVPLVEHANTHTGSLKVIRDLVQRYSDDPRVEIHIIDNTRGPGQAAEMDVAQLPHFDYNSLREELRNVLESEHQAGRISDRIYGGVKEPSAGELGSSGSQRIEQGGEGKPGNSSSARGQITFDRDLSQPSVISLLKNADLSTFLHESGHFFLEVHSDIASREGAPESITQDNNAILKWFGVKDLTTWRGMSLEEKRPFHEQFARGFEAYLFDGKAPNAEMQSVFSRFRSWLLNVYKSLTNLRVDLTPEVRGVFDRMLATDQQIQVAEQMRAYRPLFEDRKQAGMTEAEWRAYQEIGQQATEDARDELQKRSLRDMRWASQARSRALKELQATADEKRKATRAEVAADVQNEPLYRAQKALRTGKFEASPDERTGQASEAKGFKLDIEAVKEMLPNGEIPPALKGMTMAAGIHPELVAEQFGFRSGEELIGRLMDADPMKDVIDAKTDQTMLERYGDLTDPVAMAWAADHAVHNEARSRFVATELRALQRAMKVNEKTDKGGSVNILAKAAREFAEITIGRKRVRDVKPAQFDAAETRAAQASEKATRKGDFNNAVLEKRNQLINGYASRAAHAALKDIQKGLEYLGKFDRAAVRDKIDLEYRDQIDALLDRYDLRKSVTNKALGKREALAAFVDRMSAMGYEPSIPAELLDETNRQHYKDMTVEQFRGLVDGVKSIEHLGRLKNKLLDLKEERELDEVAAEAAATMEALPKQVGAQSNRGLTRIEKKWANAKSAGRSMGASLLKMEQMMDWLDARNPQGAFNRVAFRRIADAGGREADMQLAMSKRFKELVSAIPDDALKNRRVYSAEGLIDSVTGEPAKFTKKEMLALAGNVGNESNLTKVLNGEKWKREALWDFLHKNMTKADWDFVQGVGDSFESLWLEKLAMSRRLGNTNPDKIEPRPFTTPHGEYEGFYWPMVYDPARSQDVAERGARQGDAMFENIYRRANTDTGRMNTRVESYARPVLFDLDVVPRVIKDEIHDIAYREAIMDADKFLSHKDVRAGIIKALGQEYYDQLRPWLQSIANDKAVDGASLKFWQSMAHGARTRATMVGLGFRLTTMLVHGTSAGLESIAEIGPKAFSSGLADFRNPVQWGKNKDFVFERSAEMRNRMKEVDRDIREHLREIDVRMSDPATSAVQRGLDKVKANAYMGIAMLDMATALPTWMGAYKQAMAGGMGEADAVYFADKSVRNAHGGTGAKDLAAVQRGNEFFKLFTMFYSFWNHNLNRLRDTARLAGSLPATARSGDAKQFRGDLGLVVMRTLIYTLGIQVIHSAMHPDKADESWGVWAAKQLAGAATSGIPVVRDIAAHFIQGRDYAVTPAAAVVKTIGQSAHDAQLAAMGRSHDKWVKHAAEVAGYVFGLPTGQAAATAQFLWDVGDGHQQPQDITDWWNGVLHGDIKHK